MKIKLSNNGPEVSRIIAGVMTWGVWGKDYDTATIQKLIEGCIDLGVSTFDHADIYGHYTTEEAWGRAWAQTDLDRSNIQIITKCGINLKTPNRPAYNIKSYNCSKTHIINSVDQSLTNLNTDYIDILLIHRPSPLMNADEIAEAFSILKSNGKVRHFGVSNFTPSQFALLNNKIELVTNQVEASLTHTDPINDGTFDQAQKLGCSPTIWSPLGGIFKNEDDLSAEIIKKAKEISGRYDHDYGVDQIALAWLMKLPSRPIPVIGTGQLGRIKKSVKATDIQLTDEEWFELYEAARGHEVA